MAQKIIVAPNFVNSVMNLDVASFGGTTRAKALRIEPTYKENHLYVAWRQYLVTPKADVYVGDIERRPKYSVVYDIDLATGVCVLNTLKRGKLASFHLNPELDPKQPLLGYTDASGKVPVVKAESGSFVSDFEEGCAPVVVAKSLETNDLGEGDGPLYVDEPIFFVCKSKKTVWRSRPVKITGTNVYQMANIFDATAKAPRILLHPETGYEFVNPELSLKEVIEKYGLGIPKCLQDLALANPDWPIIEDGMIEGLQDKVEIAKNGKK